MDKFSVDKSWFDAVIDRRGSGQIKYDYHPEGTREDLIPMWVADMDFRSPPEVIDALQQAAAHGIYGYGSATEADKNAVRGWFFRRFGWQLGPDEIIPVPGVIFGLSQVVRALTEPGDAIMISQPVYHPFPHIVEDNGRRLVVNELVLTESGYRFDFDAFERQIAQENVKAYILCSPHNPIGRVWTKSELQTLSEICLRHEVLIFSDEIHGDFVYHGHKHTPIAALSAAVAARTVTLTAPSKTFNIAGLQASNIIVTHPALRKKIKQELQGCGCHGLNILAQRAMTAAYTHGEGWLELLLDYLEENDRLLRTALADTEIRVMPLEGTYLAWLDCRALGLSQDALYKLFLQQAGVWLQSGADFGKGGEGFLRMNIACPHETMQEALRRIRSAVES